MEMNFGFTLVSVAGVSVEAEKKDEKSDQGEFSAMKQEELMKQKVIENKERIYEEKDVNPLLAQ